ncbi:MAG: EF2563 family selenium-dependent molybdenum hydroxylase system protein [Firmicutes bacterium]|nr:EF2563 family selenium-dependent molybdenum hydroxylase system protein [Bacillota bacterium]
MNEIVIVRGGGDIASGIIQKLHRSGFRVLVLEIEHPMAIRRKVSFAQGIFDGETSVEGIRCIKANDIDDIYMIWKQGHVPIKVDENCSILNKIESDVVVDAILAKRNMGTNKAMAPITIGIGPGFEAGKDVNIVIESNRGHDLGRLIFNGLPQSNTGIPGNIAGYTLERVVKAPCEGRIINKCEIGDMVEKEQVIAEINGTEVKSKIKGVLRGLIMNNTYVKEGIKIGDVDPRGIKESCFTISEKARAIGGGVLEAILYMQNKG